MKNSTTLRSKPFQIPAIAAVLLMATAPEQAAAQLSIAAVNTPYTITFDASTAGVVNGAYDGSGFSPTPATGQLNSNAWATTGMSNGNLAFGGTNTTSDHARGTSSAAGGVTTGGFYAFNAANIGSRAFGIKANSLNWVPGTVTLRVQNTSGFTLNSIDIAYALWVNNSQSASSQFVFSWSANNSTYTKVGALDHTSPTFSDAAGYVVNNKSATISGMNVPDNAYLYLRWSGFDATISLGGRDEFALDNISITGHAPAPVLSVGALTAFGAQCENAGPYGPNSFTITGTNITAPNVTVGALNGYTYSTTAGGTYAPSLSLTHGTGSYSQVIYVKFSPTAVMNYSGSIPVGGGGASSTSVAASGSGANFAPDVSTGSGYAITATTASAPGRVNSTGCSAVVAYGIEYSTTTGFTPGTGTQTASTDLSGNDFSSALTGLAPCTPYYYRAYMTNAGGTGYGVERTLTTTAIATPVATDPTIINANDFTATWNTTPGATGYQLDVSTSPTFDVPAALTTTEGFDAGTTPPAGWTFTSMGTNTGAGDYGANSPSLRFNANNDRVVTPTLSAPASDLSFWVMQTASLVEISGLLVEGYNGSTWSTIENISPLPVTGTVKSYTGLTANGYVQFRWTYSRFGIIANGSLDDVSYTCMCTTQPSYLAGYDSLVVAGTSQTVTGLSPSTTYYYRVRAISSACPLSANSNTVTVVTENPTYYSRATGTVTDPIWSDTRTGTAGGGTFTASTNMVVQIGDVVTNTADVDVEDLHVETGGTLVLNTGTAFNIHGDHVGFAGTITANDKSTLAMIGPDLTTLGASGETINLWDLNVNTAMGTTTEATVRIRGTLLLSDGDFDASSGSLVLVSNATGTGRLGPVASGASYTGNMTVERFIPGGHTNWRFMGSPVAGQTISNWQDDFFTAGYPGSAYPSFHSPVGSDTLWPSIRYYDETNTYAIADSGVVGVTSNTQALTPGQGFLAWSGDNLSTTTAFTVDASGPPNIANAPITLPMSYTSSGTVAADGWNLVSNPLPSAIAFDSISRGSDVLDQYWVFNPITGMHETYSAGIGQGEVNGRIHSSQAFWLKANGSNLTTTVSEADKVGDLAGGVFGGFEEAVRPILRLTVASNINTYSDEATFVFDQGTPGLDPEDALKFSFHTFGAPQVASQSVSGDPMAIEFYGPYATDISIPVLVDVDVTGTYSISAAITGMQNLSCLSLEDLQTGTITPISDGASYSFAINAEDDGESPRFLLHGTAPLPFTAQNPACSSDLLGQASVEVTNGPVDIIWKTAFGNILATQSGVEDSVATITDLVAGNYSVHVSPIGACGELSADFNIAVPEPITVDQNGISATSCPNSSDGTISIMANGGTGAMSYAWNDGSTGPEFTGAAGAHQVNITDGSGCSASETFTIPAGEGAIAGFTSGTAVVDQPMAFTNTSTNSTDWTWDFGDGSTSTEMDPVHAYAASGTYTVTLTATDGNCTDIFTQDVTVDIVTTVEPVNATNALNVYAAHGQFVIDHAFGNAPVDVAVYDATGRLRMERDAIVKPGRITLSDQELGSGVWFVRVKSGDAERTFRVPVVR